MMTMGPDEKRLWSQVLSGDDDAAFDALVAMRQRRSRRLASPDDFLRASVINHLDEVAKAVMAWEPYILRLKPPDMHLDSLWPEARRSVQTFWTTVHKACKVRSRSPDRGLSMTRDAQVALVTVVGTGDDMPPTWRTHTRTIRFDRQEGEALEDLVTRVLDGEVKGLLEALVHQRVQDDMARQGHDRRVALARSQMDLDARLRSQREDFLRSRPDDFFRHG